VIDSSWKLYTDENGRTSLHDLDADPTDLSAAHPKRVERLRELHREWAKRNNVLPFEVVELTQKKGEAD
jgi:hypothetical protein